MTSERASLSGRLDRWMFSAFELSPRGAAVYRMLFAAGLLLAIKPPVWTFIADYPDSFFSPPFGVTFFFFTGFPPALYFQALNVVLVFAAVALFFGWHTRAASLALAASIFAGNMWSYSFGKINHDILFIVVPLVMAFSGWGDALSVDATRRTAPPRTNAWPLALLALLVGFAMFTAGWTKAVTGWLDPTTHATHGQLIMNYFIQNRTDGLSSLALGVEAPWFWELLDQSTVVLECALLPAVLSRAAFRVNLALLTFFHVSVMLVLRIEFPANLLGYAAFVDWEAVVRRVPRPVSNALAALPRPSRMVPALLGSVLAALAVAGASPFELLGSGFAAGLTLLGTVIAIGYLIALAVLFLNDRASFAARFRLPPPPS